MAHAGTALIDPYKVFAQISLAPGMRVADLGCGRTGHFVFPASRVIGDTGIVYAVEIVKDILESIKSRIRSEGYDNVQAIWSDIERVGKTPIPQGTLDSCFLVNVMFMLKDKVGALSEAKRLLKSGGTVVIVDWEKNLGPLGPSLDRLLHADMAIKLGAAAGLKLVNQFPAGDYHYCVIFQKV